LNEEQKKQEALKKI